MKILRPFTGTGAIFFPIGRPPKGTCEFATDCLKHCYTLENSKDNGYSNFDEEIRVSEDDKVWILKQFRDLSINTLKNQIIYELEGLQTPILHYFGSGDCTILDMDKFSELINSLRGKVIQMGFTRNIEFWKKHKDILALTIEKKEDAPDPKVMYSIPKYEDQVSVMYCPSYQIRGGYCGPIICRDRDLERFDLDHYINCKTCLRLKTGCFDRRSQKE